MATLCDDVVATGVGAFRSTGGSSSDGRLGEDSDEGEKGKRMGKSTALKKMKRWVFRPWTIIIGLIMLLPLNQAIDEAQA
jgi:hypothetical protein